jgi:cyanophycin synthetase
MSAHPTPHQIQFLRMTHLRGPNIWTYRPVIEALIDIGDLEDCPSNTLPGFAQRLVAWLPGLVEHRCSVGERGGFLKRLEEGTWPGHILEHVALELQTRAGMQTGFGKAREAGPRGVYKVVIRTRHEAVSRQALLSARDLILAAMADQAFDVASHIAQLTQMVDSLCIGPSTASIIDAAADRGIPSIRLNDGNLVQLGYGQRQRRIWTAETDRTSAIAEGISKDKDLTKQLLSMCGVPVPEGQIVDSPQAAWSAAQDIGLPVCVKPTDGNHARGVSLELSRQEDIEAAYGIALAEGSEVIVERFILGEEHRLLVVGDQVAAANKGETASVVGDGVHTVQELIELQINSDPRRGEEEDFPLDTIRLDEHTTSVLELKRQGLSAGSVPEAGREVLIMRTGNMSMDVTDLVHPDVAALAVLAARVVGLDIAGVDLVAQDISKPLGPQGGAVVEVNAGPGLLMHLKPATGQPRPVGQAIANHLFKPEDNGRIPVVGLMGDGDTTQAAQLLAWLLHLKGLHTGLSCANGLFLNQRQLPTQDGMDWAQGQRLLINRGVQAAVFESDARHLLAQGLPYDRCQIGIVTRMPRATGLDDLFPGGDEKMPGYIRTQIDVVLPEGTAVLNAAEPEVADLAEHCDGDVLLYAEDEHNARLQAHRGAGHRVGFWRDGQLVLAQGAKEHLVLSSQRPAVARLLKNGSLNTSDMLVAACAAWALDIGTDLIRAGIKSYGSLPTA